MTLRRVWIAAGRVLATELPALRGVSFGPRSACPCRRRTRIVDMATVLAIAQPQNEAGSTLGVAPSLSFRQDLDRTVEYFVLAFTNTLDRRSYLDMRYNADSLKLPAVRMAHVVARESDGQ